MVSRREPQVKRRFGGNVCANLKSKFSDSRSRNAASIAGLMITTEAMVAELPKDEEKCLAVTGATAWATWI
jgi:hypothetical protein